MAGESLGVGVSQYAGYLTRRGSMRCKRTQWNLLSLSHSLHLTVLCKPRSLIKAPTSMILFNR
ncbi:rCG60008, isoform CRA_b [Rattus norvegicus]|uniref:RCG60008, isoform CRA_b n=1 Tax=Rattus norvegicus TaxID=10116 RepID=A6HRC3_RAT|nr:rCG60008, isoform CRA_b [Rattus norvegicus]